MGILNFTISRFIFVLSMIFAKVALADLGDGTLDIKTKQTITANANQKYQLFYFWATWCPDCKSTLKSDLTKYLKPNVNFFTVSTDKDLQKIADYVLDNKVNYPVYHDEKKELQKAFKIFSVPTVVLTQKNLKTNSFDIIAQVSGTDWSEISKKLESLGN